MDIDPATVNQIRKGNDGQMYLIKDDAGYVADDLRKIDPRLKLKYSEIGKYYVVYLEDGNGDQHLVITAQECDQRIVNRVKTISSPDYDYAAELEKVDKATNKEIDYKFSEQIGDNAERLAHAIRKDLNIQTDTKRQANRKKLKGIVGS